MTSLARSLEMKSTSPHMVGTEIYGGEVYPGMELRFASQRAPVSDKSNTPQVAIKVLHPRSEADRLKMSKVIVNLNAI